MFIQLTACPACQKRGNDTKGDNLAEYTENYWRNWRPWNSTINNSHTHFLQARYKARHLDHTSVLQRIRTHNSTRAQENQNNHSDMGQGLPGPQEQS